LTEFLGLDIGTTTVTALVLDVDSGKVLSVATLPNDSEVTSAADKARGRSEWDANRMMERSAEAISKVASGSKIEGIGVTGQMHGMLLVSSDGAPVSPFVGWQDRRGSEPLPHSDATSVETMLELARETGAACLPHVGYLGVSLFWMGKQGMLPKEAFKAAFLPDFIVAGLTGTTPVTDATNAAGSGLYDAENRSWHMDFVHGLGLDSNALPTIVDSGALAGKLDVRYASATGLPAGLPVYAACGDNQASFAGSVADYAASLLINVGTGGQVSANVPEAVPAGELEARPFMDGSDLMVGAGLVGGRSYAWLRDFFRQIGDAFFGQAGETELYDKMNQLASQVPPGSDGLHCEPLFTGTRTEPDRRGIWKGVGTANFTPGHVARALLEGLASQFLELYQQMEALDVGNRTKLVGAGNGIRKNALLRTILQDSFEMRMVIPKHKEEAAFGAALLAAVGGGRFETLPEASTIIRYQ
jgi:sugar (pentulose or hexulose) kinase